MNLSDDELNQLIRMLKSDDKKLAYSAFKKLYRPLKAFISPILSGLRNRYKVEDAVQEIMKKTWEMRQSLDAIKDFRAYFFTMAKNMVIENSRDMSKTKEALKDYGYVLDKTDNLHEPKDYSVFLPYMAASISKLPPSHRRIFYLAVQRRKKHKYIAKVTNLHVRTITRLKQKALALLRQELENRLKSHTTKPN